MKTTCFSAAVLLCAAVSLTAADLLPNAGFANRTASGAIAGWTLRDTPVKKDLPPRSAERPAASAVDGVLTLDTEGGKFEVMLIHFHTPVKPGKQYTLSMEVRRDGDSAVNYRAVVYWTTQKDGKTVWTNTPGNWRPAPAEWTHIEVPFTVAEDRKDAYCYLAANGPGKAEFRGVRLRDAGVDPVTDNELAVFRPGEKVVYRIENLIASDNTVVWKLTDFDEKTVAEGSAGKGDVLEFADLPNGWYALDADERDASGKSVALRRRTFSVIPEVPESVRASEKNQFGAMVNPHTYYPMEQRTRDAQYMHRIGVRYVRTHRLNWVQLQPKADQPPNWESADRQTEIYRKYGLLQVATTGWPTPGWASDAAGTNLPRKANFVPKPELMEQHRQFYTELAKRYKDSVAYWEIGNEVDASNFWMGRAEHAAAGDDNAIFQDYVDYYIATAKAIKAGAPDALVGPGTTGAVPEGHTYKPWLERFWSSPAREYADIFCPHYSADLARIRAVMEKHGKVVPIVLTEIGGLVKTETYEESPALLRQIIKRTYSHFVPQITRGGKALCKFLLRRIPEVREGWISEMLDADYTQRPEYAAYATLIRLTGDGDFEKELNLTANASSGWVEAYRVRSGSGIVNIILLNDTDRADVTLPSDAEELKLVDVMGREQTVPVRDGKVILPMREDTPVFVIGELKENPGPVKHPEPQLVERKVLTVENADFELAPDSDGRIPGWKKLTNELRPDENDAGKAPFNVVSDAAVKASGSRSVRMSSEVQTRWFGIICQLPVEEIPQPKPGQWVVFKVSYDQKAEKVVGTGVGLTLALRASDMRRVDFGGGNWVKGSFDWTHRVWTSRKYTEFHHATKFITLEFYLGVATGTVWIDNVQVEVELWQKSNASAAYIN